jgi:membrane-associated protein
MDFILHIDKYLAYIINQYHALTYLILFTFIFAETGLVVAPFVPGDSLLFAAGTLIAGGSTGLSIYLLAGILIVAAFAGNTVNYFVGKYLGPKVFKKDNKILKLEYYYRTKDFFDKHGGKAVILSRFVPIIRTIAPFVAGVGKMPFAQYSLYNIAGGVSWVICLLFVGYFFGNIPLIKNNFTIVILVIIVVSLIPPIYTAIKSRPAKSKK